MRIVFFGSGEFGIPSFRSLASDGHTLVAAVSQPDRPAGRGRRDQPTPLRIHAQTEGVPVLTPEDCNAPDCVASLSSLHAELAFVAAFGQKIGAAVRDLFPVGIINLHASLLPAYRGAAPAQRAILGGESHTGVTVFRLVERMDAGPVLAQRSTAIGDEETTDLLLDRLARIGCDCLRAALERLVRNPADPGDAQDESRATRAPKFAKSDGWVEFSAAARTASRRINALYPWPGAAARFVSSDGQRDEPVIVAQAFPVACAAGAEPGTVLGDLRIATGDAAVELMAVKPANGRLMTWRDFVNGRRVRPGDRFLPAPVTPHE
ncbi:MAG: methionyl-tRNA formyltransferase [Phycisphaerae bacterium]